MTSSDALLMYLMCVYSIFLASCKDTALGKFDPSMLSQQALMELFVSGLTNVERWRSDTGEFKDIAGWNGVRINANEDVIEINYMESNSLSDGSLRFDCLPQTVRHIYIGESDVSGEIAWNKLPNESRYITICDCAFFGSLDLTALPMELVSLVLASLKLSGTLDCRRLPPNLLHLDVSDNIFSGSVDLRCIQKDICHPTLAHSHLGREYLGIRHPLSTYDFGIFLIDNRFEGDILVRDIVTIRDHGQFSGNQFRFIVDDHGMKKRVLQDDDIVA